MSYSFSARGATKSAASEDAAKKMAEVVAAQPVHAADQVQAAAAAKACIDILADDDTKDVALSCNGSISTSSDGKVQGVSINVSANLATKPAA